MIASGVVVYVSCQPVDFRKGAASLMALVRDGGLDPFNSALYVFRSKRKDRVRIVWWDGSGVCLYSNDLNSYCITLLASVEGFGLAFALVKRGDAINELVPSTALLLRQICLRKLVQVIVSVVGMAGDEAMFSPSGEGVLMDIEVCSRLLFC